MVKSVMVHSFSEVPRADIPRSSFDRSHGLKGTYDADLLYPILMDDIVPGDTFSVSCNFMARLASPTIYPLLDNLVIETFFFFVPYRLLWDNWEKFMGAQHDPADTIAYTIPVLEGAETVLLGGLGDHLGLPVTVSGGALVDASALPFRAYHLIWNEWFRDQNLQDSYDIATDNGPDSAAQSSYNAVCLSRGKRHDYFTSALPWPQKGTALSLLGTENLLVSHQGSIAGKVGLWSDGEGAGQAIDSDGATADISTTTATAAETMYVDLDEATLTINSLRLAFQTQKLLERDARSGTRYTETILAHYGVTVPDFRVQRPEFLGGGSSPISISPVAQTTYQTTQTLEDAKGALGGIGTAGGTHSFTKSFTEHGLIIGLCNVRGDITYSQEMDRYWRKSTRYDFYYPILAQIGEQSILNSEIFYSSSPATDDAVFGYQERYAEYRYKPSRLVGLMGVDAVGTLAAFHLSEDFSSVPTLNAAFIASSTATPLDRAISVPAQPQFVVDWYFKMKCARPMPMFGVPGNMDRF